MPETAALTDRVTEIWSDPPNLYGWLVTVGHKKIGKRYLVTAMAFLIIGGLEAVLMRIQLKSPNAGILAAELYNQIMTIHGTTMIFWYAVNAQSFKPGARMPTLEQFDGETLNALAAYLESLE